MPVATLNVDAETPVSVQGDIEDRPKPAPSASSGSITADVTIAPAAMLPHETADGASVKIALSARTPLSIGRSCKFFQHNAVSPPIKSRCDEKFPGRREIPCSPW